MPFLCIKTIGYTFSIDSDVGNSISDFKKEILLGKNIPIVEQILFFNGKILEDEKTLAHYNIGKESIIYLFLNSDIINILGDINIIKNDINDIKNKNNTFTLPNIVILASIGVIGVTLFGISTAIFLELKKEKRKAA